MLAAIKGAQRQILFETYIWKGDEVGQRLKDALAAAAARGVEVYCVYDGFANLVSPRFKRFPPGTNGAEVAHRRPRCDLVRRGNQVSHRRRARLPHRVQLLSIVPRDPRLPRAAPRRALSVAC